jgi:hypothetical protein
MAKTHQRTDCFAQTKNFSETRIYLLNNRTFRSKKIENVLWREQLKHFLVDFFKKKSGTFLTTVTEKRYNQTFFALKFKLLYVKIECKKPFENWI